MADPTALRHPVFIVGMPRSGTTLLSSLLDAHSQLSISPETHFYSLCRSDDPSAEQSVGEIWNCLQQQVGVQRMGLTGEERERIRERLSGADPATPPDLLRALCSTYAERSGAGAWGEKTPDHLAHVPTIFKEFPEALVLCIVRDPRDVCLSLRGVPWNRKSLPESAYKWRRYAQASERHRHEYPDRFREVRYEDVLDAPERVIREILDWIGAPFEEQMLAFHRRGDGPADPDREPWKAKTRRPVDPTNKEKWRDQMGPAERWILQLITRPLLQKKGYGTEPVAVDRSFLSDLGCVVVQSCRVILRRMYRRWKASAREPGDYRPVWVRRQSE